MQERKAIPIQRPDIVVFEEKSVELPKFDLAKVKLSEDEIKQVKECLLLEEEIKSLTESKRLTHNFSDWKVIDEDLLVQRIELINLDEYFGKTFHLAFLYNLKTRQCHHLLDVMPKCLFSWLPIFPDHLVSIDYRVMKIWNLHKSIDYGCALLERQITLNIELFERGYEIHQVQAFPDADHFTILMESCNGRDWNNHLKRNLHIINLGLDKKDDSSLPLKPLVNQYSDYCISNYCVGDTPRGHVRDSCQILNEKEFLVIEYDWNHKPAIVFNEVRYFREAPYIAHGLQRIPLTDLKISEDKYSWSYLSAKGKFLVIAELEDFQKDIYTFTSFRLENNEKGIYSYVQLSKVQVIKACSFTECFLSINGNLQWRDRHDATTRLFTWDVRTTQIKVVPFSFILSGNSFRNAYHYADNVFSVITSNRDWGNHRLSYDFTKYYIDDPLIIFAARPVLKSFSNEVLDIVAGYLSKNTSAFFTSNASAVGRLSVIQKEKNDKETQDALEAFFDHDKQRLSLDSCAIEALKYKPDVGVTCLLLSILQSFQSMRGYDEPTTRLNYR